MKYKKHFMAVNVKWNAQVASKLMGKNTLKINVEQVNFNQEIVSYQ